MPYTIDKHPSGHKCALRGVWKVIMGQRYKIEIKRYKNHFIILLIGDTIFIIEYYRNCISLLLNISFALLCILLLYKFHSIIHYINIYSILIYEKIIQYIYIYILSFI